MTNIYVPGLFSPRQPDELIYVVREAGPGGDRRKLAKLPWRIYRGDRYWSPPSRRHATRILSPGHNPSLQQTPVELFVAEARNGVVGDEIIGGIAVWRSRDAEGEAVAHFGMFEVANNPEVGEALIEAAEFGLMERDPVEAIRGPFSLDTRRAAGLLVDGFNVSSGPFLPYNAPYYPEMIEHAGYEPVSETYAFILSADASAVSHDPVNVVSPKEEPEAWAQFVAGAPAFQRAVVAANPGAFGLTMMDVSGNVAAGLILIPNAGGATRVRGLSGRLFKSCGGRLLALSVGAPEAPDAESGLRDLYAAAALRAHRIGAPEVLCAPIPAEDAPTLRALKSLGAHKVQTYRIYEKRF